MEKFIISLLCLINLVHFSQSRSLWESPLPEISVTYLEKDKPIQLQQNYQKLQITGLNGTLYFNSLTQLHNVTEIRIIKNHLTLIEPGALCISKDLKVLELDISGNKNPPVLTKNIFNKCDVEELFLKFDYDNPSTMDSDALDNISNLKVLGIDSLRIPHLRKNLFDKMQKLEKLFLSNIHVTTIDPDVFNNLVNLNELEIVHNAELTNLPEGIFKKLGNMKRLTLKDNVLKNVTWNEFQGLSSLEELDVTDNLIKHFDADKIATNMPNLKKLYMKINPVECKQFQHFVAQLKRKLNQVEVPNNTLFNPCSGQL